MNRSTVEPPSGPGQAVPPVRGRFAPTPSGPLHFGSLVSALASALDCRTRGGTWFLRIDDLDARRTRPGIAEQMLKDLAHLGFEWNAAVHHQGRRSARYREAVERLRARGSVFDCACSRSDVARVTAHGPQGPLYPGTCRAGLPPGGRSRSLRLRVPQATIAFDDEWRGRIVQNLAREVGDFVVWRADGVAAYHLATVVDDAELGISRIVRGVDLLDATPRQILIQRLLGLPTPAYAHHPLVTARGRKLGKQTHAAPIAAVRPAAALVDALAFLRQAPPADLARAPVAAVWDWALEHWNSGALAVP